MAAAFPKSYAKGVKLASWNVNSIRARETLLLDWLSRTQPDVVCLQETKVVDDDFPTDDLMRLGYAVAMSGQPTYNGVAILSRLPFKDVRIGLLGEGPSADRRAISAVIGGLRVMSVYVPNGKAVGSSSFAEKLSWLERLRRTLQAWAEPACPLLLCGDFNIATDERDVYAPELFRGKLHFHPDERRALQQLLDLGLVDLFRHEHPQPGLYTWWDYRSASFPKNEGLRIDYVFASESLLQRLVSATIDRETRGLPKPSDHAPVTVQLSNPAREG